MNPMIVGGIGIREIVLIVFAVFLLFGTKRLPQMIKNLGLALREMRSTVNEIEK